MEQEIEKLEAFIASYPGEQYYVGDSEYAEDAVEQENSHNRRVLGEAQARLKYLKSKLEV